VSYASLSLASYEVSYLRRLVSRLLPTFSPHTLSRLGLHADLVVVVPGFLPPKTQPFSLEIGSTSLKFPTSLMFSSV
jgi:hypothetical protein